MTDRQASIVPISPALTSGYRLALDSVARERKFLSTLEAPPFERTEAFVTNNIQNGNPHFVALLGDEVVGWCDIYRETHPWAQHAGILGMGVVAAHRGRGIGRRLIEAALQAARTAKFHRVELEVFGNNTPAIALYERVGFTHEGRRRHAYKLPDGYCDLLVMSQLFPG
jgi:ribosomal protein S18 acetylase RimI-like enzyme